MHEYQAVQITDYIYLAIKDVPQCQAILHSLLLSIALQWHPNLKMVN